MLKTLCKDICIFCAVYHPKSQGSSHLGLRVHAGSGPLLALLPKSFSLCNLPAVLLRGTGYSKHSPQHSAT